jgi:hypothetical protein
VTTKANPEPPACHELLEHYLGCKALVFRAAVFGRVDMCFLETATDGTSKRWTLVALAAPERLTRSRWPAKASKLVVLLRRAKRIVFAASGFPHEEGGLQEAFADAGAAVDDCAKFATWIFARGWRFASTGLVRCEPQSAVFVRRQAALYVSMPAVDERLLHGAVDDVWQQNKPSLAFIDRGAESHEAGHASTAGGDDAAGPPPCCETCGRPDFAPSLWGLCAECVADSLQSDRGRLLLVHDDKARFVVPAEPPQRREPQPREPDDITDPWELAEHRGDPVPEDVWEWERALQDFHEQDRGILVDSAGHTFGPIEIVAGSALPVSGDQLDDWMRIPTTAYDA